MYNVYLDDEIKDLQETFQKRTNSRPIKATLGDARGVVPDRSIPGNVLFRTKTSLGPSAPRSAFLPRGTSVDIKKVGTPILLGWDYTGTRLVVLGPDSDTSRATGVDTLSSAVRDKSPSTPQAYLETLRLVSNGGFVFGIKAWNKFKNGVYREVSYTGVDISAEVPDPGEMCYVLISILGDLSDVEITSSTPRGVYDEVLDQDDVQEAIQAATEDSIPLWALRITGDQDGVTQNQIDNDPFTKDIRQVVNDRGIYKFTPADTADPGGTEGDVAWDDDYIYVKTGDGWKRSALSTF